VPSVAVVFDKYQSEFNGWVWRSQTLSQLKPTNAHKLLDLQGCFNTTTSC
jgi:hypothetical protein